MTSADQITCGVCCRRVKQSEIDEERDKLESLQRELQGRLLAMEGETQFQRDHMMADFEEVSGSVNEWSCT